MYSLTAHAVVLHGHAAACFSGSAHCGLSKLLLYVVAVQGCLHMFGMNLHRSTSDPHVFLCIPVLRLFSLYTDLESFCQTTTHLTDNCPGLLIIGASWSLCFACLVCIQTLSHAASLQHTKHRTAYCDAAQLHCGCSPHANKAAQLLPDSAMLHICSDMCLCHHSMTSFL